MLMDNIDPNDNAVNKSNITNMVNINVNGLYGELTQFNDHFFYVGQIFYQKQLLSVEQLYTLVKNNYLTNTWQSIVLEFSGFYSFVYYNEHTLLAVIDRVRSRPLFYALENKTLHLADSAQWLVEQLSITTVNKLAEQELSQAGYVSGADTLVEQIKQIPAACYLHFDVNGCQLDSYYQFMPKNNNADFDSANEQMLVNGLDECMKESIKQLITYANGRQLVIPLSGGYDSRAIALYVKALNYNNVLTFTFGRATSQEVVISKKVAHALGFEWHFVEYNRKLWNTHNNSHLFNQFLAFISNFVSVPNVQVYPAIQLLVENNVIDNNAILVPGHTGDFTSGGHIPQYLIGKAAQGNTQLIVDAIVKRHYRNKSKIKLNGMLKEKLAAQINVYMEKAPENLPAISVFEGWEYNERQAKFIVNSNRYYDFFNLDWWMPLWDNQMVAFWENVPLKHRLKSSFWQSFVEDKYQEISGDKLTYGNVKDQCHPNVQRIRNVLDYFTDVNALYALVPFSRWLLRKLKYPYANGSLFSYLSAKMIKRQKRMITKK